jgi:uncharacterized membrane protein
MMDRIAFDFPMGFYAGLPLAAVVLALFAWSQARRGIAKRQVILSVALRAVPLLVLVVLAARPVWVKAQEKSRSTVLLLADRSGSMSLEDGTTTRFRQALTFAGNAMLPALKRAELRPKAFLFAEDTVGVDVPMLGAAAPDGKRTNLAGALVQALAGAGEPPLAAIVLTDGAVNVASDNARALAALVESRVPFVGIGFGSETGVGTLSLRRAISPPMVSPNEEFHVSAQLEMSSAAELPPFDLLLLRDGRLLEKKAVSAGKGQRMWLENFAVKEENEGVHTYTVQLQPPAVEGLRSPDTLAATHVRVLKSKELRVLYVQGALSWNYKFVRLAVAGDPTVKLTGLTRTSTRTVFHQDVESPGELAGGFPSTLEQIAPFRVVVLSNLKPGDLTAIQQDLLKRFCRDFGGGVLMIGGNDAFDSSWQNSRLEEMLPVRFAGGPLAPDSFGSFRLQLTEEALAHPVFQIADSAALRAAWSVKLPMFRGYARVETAKAGAQVWAVHPNSRAPNGQPRILIAEQRYGAGISAVICMENLWSWRLAKASDPQQFDRFWQQLFRYLSEGSSEDLAIRFPDQDLSPKSDIRAVIERRPDPQNPAGVRDYKVRIEDAERKLVKEQAIKLAPVRPVEVTFQVATAGVYTITVLDPSGGPQASRTIEIRDVSIEFQRAARDMETLRQWAGVTGGIAVKAEDCSDAGDLVARIKAQAAHPPRQSQTPLPAGVNRWVLALLLACLCAEWGFRKRWGLP